jgi:hypothetical protein
VSSVSQAESGRDSGGVEQGGLHDAQHDLLHSRMVQLLERYSLASQEHHSLSGDQREEDPTGWAQAASKRLTCHDPESQFVIDYAYDRLRCYRENVQSRKVADEYLRLNAMKQHPKYGQPDPSGLSNCWPPSIECCEAILRKPDLSRYLIHCCPKGCEHWWTYLADSKQHFRECGGCALCRCPHCDACRFVKDRRGIRGSARCWLFFDAFQNMVLNADLAEALLRGRKARNSADVPDEDPYKPSLAKYKEGKRLQQVLPGQGYSTEKVGAVLSVHMFSFRQELSHVYCLVKKLSGMCFNGLIYAGALFWCGMRWLAHG